MRKDIGWDEHKFLKQDVSATSILDKDVEDYLFKNEARKEYFKMLKRGVSNDSISDSRLATHNLMTDLKKDKDSIAYEWTPYIDVKGTSTARKW